MTTPRGGACAAQRIDTCGHEGPGEHPDDQAEDGARAEQRGQLEGDAQPHAASGHTHAPHHRRRQAATALAFGEVEEQGTDGQCGRRRREDLQVGEGPVLGPEVRPTEDVVGRRHLWTGAPSDEQRRLEALKQYVVVVRRRRQPSLWIRGHRHDRRGVGADAHEGGLGERDLAGVAERQVEAHGGDGHDQPRAEHVDEEVVLSEGGDDERLSLPRQNQQECTGGHQTVLPSALPSRPWGRHQDDDDQEHSGTAAGIGAGRRPRREV